MATPVDKRLCDYLHTMVSPYWHCGDTPCDDCGPYSPQILRRIGDFMSDRRPFYRSCRSFSFELGPALKEDFQRADSTAFLCVFHPIQPAIPIAIQPPKMMGSRPPILFHGRHPSHNLRLWSRCRLFPPKASPFGSDAPTSGVQRSGPSLQKQTFQ